MSVEDTAAIFWLLLVTVVVLGMSLDLAPPPPQVPTGIPPVAEWNHG